MRQRKGLTRHERSSSSPSTVDPNMRPDLGFYYSCLSFRLIPELELTDIGSETAQRKIHELRQEAETSWQEALALAHAAAPNMPRDSDFPRVLNEAIDSYRALGRARQRADT